MQTTMSHRLAVRGGLALSSLIAFALLSPACAKRDLRPLNPCTVSASSEVLNVLPAEDIDLLFVVDNSGSMAEEQAALQTEIGRIVETLISESALADIIAANPDLEGAEPVKRLRVGTISTDLGVAGFGQNETLASLAPLGPAAFDEVVPGCGATFDSEATVVAFDAEETRTGDRGVINLEPVSATIGAINCPASYPSFLFFDVDTATQTPLEFAEDVSCTTVLGTGGCGFEMQLEAMLKAVTPSTSELVSFADVHGTGVADLPYPEGNAGFFRDEAILAIIMITDEDDCSTANPRMFDPTGDGLTDPDAPLHPIRGEPFRYNTRCTFFDDELYPVERYVEGLLKAKPANKLIFAGIVGVPDDAVDPVAQRDGVAGFDSILNHADMQVTDYVEAGEPLTWATIPGQPVGADSVVPACWRCLADPLAATFADCPAATAEQLQYAVPARRIVEFARGLREQDVISVVHTVCTDTYTEAITNILVRIIEATMPSCLNRALNADATGAVPCNFLETLPTGQRCADLEDQGREATPYKVEEDGRETCRLVQQIPTEADRTARTSPEGLGWFYDDYTEEIVGPDGMSGRCGDREVKAMVRFTDGTIPTSGGTVRIDCLQPAQAEKDINTPCVGDAACQFDDEDGLSAFIVRWNLDADRFSVGGDQPMSCDSNTNTCQIDCQNDSDCPGGMVCSEDDGNVCLDPTCNIR